jgi:hypothetical protein
MQEFHSFKLKLILKRKVQLKIEVLFKNFTEIVTCISKNFKDPKQTIKRLLKKY